MIEHLSATSRCRPGQSTGCRAHRACTHPTTPASLCSKLTSSSPYWLHPTLMVPAACTQQCSRAPRLRPASDDRHQRVGSQRRSRKFDFLRFHTFAPLNFPMVLDKSAFSWLCLPSLFLSALPAFHPPSTAHCSVADQPDQRPAVWSEQRASVGRPVLDRQLCSRMCQGATGRAGQQIYEDCGHVEALYVVLC